MCGHIRCSDCSGQSHTRLPLYRNLEFEEWVFVGRPASETMPPFRSYSPEPSTSSKTLSEDYTFHSTLDRIFAHYNDWKQQTADQDGSSSSGEANEKQYNQGIEEQAASTSNRKRTINDTDASLPSDEDGIALKSKKTRFNRSQKLLACPFWKRNCSRHRECSKFKLSGIGRVKQHLKRRHQPRQRPLIQCGRCGQIFPQMAGLDQHLQQDQLCESGNFEVHELSEHQSTDLSRLSDRRLSIEDQWYAMWDIIHPGIARPASPYVEQGLSEDLQTFHEYMMSQGIDILLEENRINTLIDNDRLQMFLQAGIRRIINGFINTRLDSTMTNQDYARSTAISAYSGSPAHRPQSQGNTEPSSTVVSIPLEEMDWEQIESDWLCLDEEGEEVEDCVDEEPERNFEDLW